jgi:glycosyltransferase involved in cell wall biosynthesis
LGDNWFLSRKLTVQRKIILLLIPHLGGGGAEHVMALLARGLSQEKYEVHLGLVQQAGVAGDALPPWVTIHPLGAVRARAGALPLLRLVWRLRPSVVVSCGMEISFLALLLRPFFPPKTCVIVRQNATVSSALAFADVPRSTRLLYRLLYRRSDRVICQSRAMAGDLAQVAGIGDEQIAVLPNPVDLEGIRAAWSAPSVRSGAGPHLLAVGRLSWEKGFDLLLRAFAVVREHHPDADLIIAGSGREEGSLVLLCRSLGLETAVCFAGQVDRPYAFFPGATLFVFSSRYEGMPNALLEAAAAGLPLVATPASGGVVDLLRDRPGAWLAPEISAEALATTILSALDAIRPGERFCHPFFPSSLQMAQPVAGDCESQVPGRQASASAQR